MKNRCYFGLFFVYLVTWCHLANGLAPLQATWSSQQTDELVNNQIQNHPREQRSIDTVLSVDDFPPEEEFEIVEWEEPEDNHHHHIEKRTIFKKFKSLKKLIHSPAKCGGLLKLCSLVPFFNKFCILNCMIQKSDVIKKLLFVIQSTVSSFCLMVNTIFPTIPQTIIKNKIRTVKQFLRFFSIKTSGQADFAKTSCNALAITLMKYSRGIDFDELKPVLGALELEDEEMKGRRLKAMRSSQNEGTTGKDSGINLQDLFLPNFNRDALGSGNFLNTKCKKSGQTGVLGILAEVFRKRLCLTDAALPGYFVFNRAPAIAWTKPILPILRAWNMPLLMLTGAKCCIIPYVDKKKQFKCYHNYDIFDEKPKPQPGQTPVCGAIPEFLMPRSDRPEVEGEPEPCSEESKMYDDCYEDLPPETFANMDYTSFEDGVVAEEDNVDGKTISAEYEDEESELDDENWQM